MTRKHFEAVAITIGAQMREHAVGDDAWCAILTTANLLCHDFRRANPSFDSNRFLQFVLDVANGDRDLDGKAVAA